MRDPYPYVTSFPRKPKITSRFKGRESLNRDKFTMFKKRERKREQREKEIQKKRIITNRGDKERAARGKRAKAHLEYKNDQSEEIEVNRELCCLNAQIT